MLLAYPKPTLINMKKSTIWLLTIVMAITFGALLYFQIMYLENMVKMREAQFSENVMRSLYATAGYLEREETLHFLEEDVNIIESSLYDSFDDQGAISYSVESPDGRITNYRLSSTVKKEPQKPRAGFPSPTEDISSRYKSMQEVIRSQYLYQRGLLNEVILNILRESGSRPITERADSSVVRRYLTMELANNGLNEPFVFAVANEKSDIIYQTEGYDPSLEKGIYTQALFPNTNAKYYLKIEFPTKNSYIFSSVRFLIPTLSLTLILLVIFLYTIIVAFRQKKLTEMKSDFINNMTHELKTPISTISLAGQMLSDDSVRKSPTSLKHLSQVITEESKRLRFQVEKVLQLSVFDNTGSAMKLTVVNADTIISNVVNTFKIKVEKFGGTLSCSLAADNPYVKVDEMQFTNVIFNLLDNAVKYMREDEPLYLEISTRNPDEKRIEICIKDNGIGIKKDDLKHIFEKFYRVPTGNRHDVKGFGLGLAYVKKMVSIFDGEINVESEFGAGTCFIITLPTVKDPDKTDESYTGQANNQK